VSLFDLRPDRLQIGLFGMKKTWEVSVAAAAAEPTTKSRRFMDMRLTRTRGDVYNAYAV